MQKKCFNYSFAKCASQIARNIISCECKTFCNFFFFQIDIVPFGTLFILCFHWLMMCDRKMCVLLSCSIILRSIVVGVLNSCRAICVATSALSVSELYITTFAVFFPLLDTSLRVFHYSEHGIISLLLQF